MLQPFSLRLKNLNYFDDLTQSLIFINIFGKNDKENYKFQY